MSSTNQYGTRDASVRLARIRGQVRYVSKLQGIQTVRGGPSGSFSNPASNLIDTNLISSVYDDCQTCAEELSVLPGLPGPPQNVVAAPFGSETVIVFFDAPVSDGGYPITSYSIVYGATSISPATSPTTITGLSNGADYTFFVRAHNSIGSSAPASDTATPSGTTTLTRRSFTDTSAPETWIAPDGVEAVQYLIVGGGGGGGAAHDNSGAGGGGGGLVLTGYLPIAPGSTYSATVGAGGAAGVGSSGIPRETDGSVGGGSIFSTVTSPGGTGGFRSRAVKDGGTNGAGGAAGVDATLTAPGSGNGGRAGSGGGGGGGGGGDSGAGANRNNTAGGTGGAGTSSSITVSPVVYGVGGSGGTISPNPGTGTNGSTSAANVGKGGDAGGSGFSFQISGQDGGSGIVAILYYV